MPIRVKRAVPGRLVGKRFYPNPKSSGSEDALYRVFRKKGYSRSEARRLAKLNAPYFASNPVGRWVEAKGSPIKQIRFRDDGYADVVIVPRRGNASIRDLKKDLKRAGHPERIIKQVVRTAKGYARSKKLVELEDRARKKNPREKEYYVTRSTDQGRTWKRFGGPYESKAEAEQKKRGFSGGGGYGMFRIKTKVKK